MLVKLTTEVVFSGSEELRSAERSQQEPGLLHPVKALFYSSFINIIVVFSKLLNSLNSQKGPLKIKSILYSLI
jgi:hypothetical protein